MLWSGLANERLRSRVSVDVDFDCSFPPVRRAQKIICCTPTIVECGPPHHPQKENITTVSGMRTVSRTQAVKGGRRLFFYCQRRVGIPQKR